MSLQSKLLHYGEYLQEKYHQENSTIRNRISILKGTFVLPLADDFDESLEDFEEYMT